MTGVPMRIVLPVRPPMSLLGGGVAGALVAAATGTAGGVSGGDHAVTVALITVCGGLFTALAIAVVGPLIASRIQGRRKDLADRLVDQLEERNEEITRLHEEITALRRKRRRT